MKKLMTLSEYVTHLKKDKESRFEPQGMLYQQAICANLWDKACDYNDLITQSLSLPQFIPCDKKGEPMEAPKKCNCQNHLDAENCQFGCYSTECNEYQQALGNVIFEGWELANSDLGIFLFYGGYDDFSWEDGCLNHVELGNFNTPEDLLTAGIELTLTDQYANKLKL